MVKRGIRKRGMAFLLAAALVLGQSNVAFAAENAVQETGQNVTISETEVSDELSLTSEEEAGSEETEAEADSTPVPEESPDQEEVSEETPEPTQIPEEETMPEESTEPSVSASPEEGADLEEGETPAETASPEESETPAETASPEEAEELSESPSPDAAATPSAMPEEETKEYELFPGLEEGYSFSLVELQNKSTLQEYVDEISEYEEGTDYVENEILVEAETRELGEEYAKAFNGELQDWFDGIAVITLNAGNAEIQASVADAVIASANSSMMLPAAWPNYYYSIADETEEFSEEAFTYVAAEETDEVTLEEVAEAERTEVTVEDGGDGTVSISAYNDPYLKESDDYYQWYHEMIDSPAAWNAGYKGKGITVAVVDTGIISDHQDVSATAYNIGLGTEDENGHGTHVAGIIGAKGNNGYGGSGVAPEVNLISVRVLDAEGYGETSDIIKGFNKAVSAGADVVNMSLGGAAYSEIFEKAIETAYEKGVVVVCAAGNSATNGQYFPASYAHVISVAALDKGNGRAYFSNYGGNIRYSAPGVSIYSTYIGGDASYTSMSGTSQAAPVVAAEAAMLLASGKVTGSGSKKVDNLIKLMDASSVKVNGTGLGKGYVSLSKALGISTSTSKPTSPVFSVKAGTYAQSSVAVTITAENGNTIYYSLDGKDVTYKNGMLSANAKTYTGAVSVTGAASVTLKAIAVNPTNGLVSSMTTAKYTLKPIVSKVTIQSATGTNVVAKGKSLTLTATVTPSYAKDKAVKWTIDGTPKGISVKNGVVSVKNSAAAGTYTVRATAKDAKGNYAGAVNTFKISVVEASTNPVTVLKVNSSKVTVVNKKTASVTATVTKKDKSAGSAASDIKWTSGDTAIATVAVSENTLTITGKKAGKTSITGVAKDGSGKKVTLTVTVTEPVTEVKIIGPSTMAAGTSITLKATVTPDNATNQKVKWEMVTKTNDVTISSTGKLTAKANISANKVVMVRATATDGSGCSFVYNIRVTKEGMTSLKADKSAVTIFRVANQFKSPTSATINLTITGSNKDKWEIINSNPDLVTTTITSTTSLVVKAKGTATGTATITIKATDGSNRKATCKVTVVNPPTSLRVGAPSGRVPYLAKGKSLQLSAVIGDEYGPLSASSKKLKWTSSNPTVLKVSSNGKVTALGSSGYARIKVEATDGSGISASYDVYARDETTKIIMDSTTNTITMEQYESISYWVGAKTKSGGSSSYMFEISVNKPGLTVGYNSSWRLASIKANKKGTYKVTISCQDGSKGKKTYTIKVK